MTTSLTTTSSPGLIATLRKPKIGPYAIFDFVASFAVAAAVAPSLGISRERAVWAVTPVSVATHAVFGVDTPLTRQVLNPDGDYVPKIVVGLSLLQALRPSTSETLRSFRRV